MTLVTQAAQPTIATMTLSEDLKERVISLYSSGGFSMRDVAELLDVSLGLVQKVVSCSSPYESCDNSKEFRLGRSCIKSYLFVVCQK